MVATLIMGMVITGGLVGLGQATLLSEKSSEQATADFLLRAEVEHLRSLNWIEVQTYSNELLTYENLHGGSYYTILLSISAQQLADLNISVEIKSQALGSSGETGKIIFHLTLDWDDRTGKSHKESRVLVITEGGFSAHD
jgi:hypothetical protein